MRKVLADMHVPPAWRRWSTRALIAAAIALAVAYVPWRVAGGGDQVEKLRGQLAHIRAEAAALEADNATKQHEIEALKTDPRAIEQYARDELGMVYAGELVMRVQSEGDRP